MAKSKKSIFFCQNCGHEENKWLGQCPVCREWNTFVEEKDVYKRQRWMIASDIHGSAYYCRKMIEAYRREKADKDVYKRQV